MLEETREFIYTQQVRIASLLLYQNVLDQAPWEAYEKLFKSLANYVLDGHENSSRQLSYLFAYGQWFRAIAATGYNWRDYVILQILTSENPFSQLAQVQDFSQLPTSLISAVKHDLKILEEMSLWGGDKWVNFVNPESNNHVAWQLSPSDLSRV
ncbi:MAG: hypothetical protein ACK58Z_16215 [Pseudanabaena sp.]